VKVRWDDNACRAGDREWRRCVFGRLVGRSTNGMRQQGHAVFLALCFSTAFSQGKNRNSRMYLRPWTGEIRSQHRFLVSILCRRLRPNPGSGRGVFLAQVNATDVRRIVADGRLRADRHPAATRAKRNQGRCRIKCSPRHPKRARRVNTWHSPAPRLGDEVAAIHQCFGGQRARRPLPR